MAIAGNILGFLAPADTAISCGESDSPQIIFQPKNKRLRRYVGAVGALILDPIFSCHTYVVITRDV